MLGAGADAVATAYRRGGLEEEKNRGPDTFNRTKENDKITTFTSKKNQTRTVRNNKRKHGNKMKTRRHGWTLPADDEEEGIKAVKLRAKGSDVTWKKEDLAEKIQEQGNNKRNAVHPIGISQPTRRNNKEPQHKTGRERKIATITTLIKSTKNS